MAAHTGHGNMRLAAVAAVLCVVGASSSAALTVPAAALRRTKRVLPDPVLAVYANWGQCDEKMENAALDGANVLIWFSINLARDEETGQPVITGPATGAAYFDCVADTVARIRGHGLEVTHLVSIGGWNSPHPATEWSGEEWAATWHEWNTGSVARPERGFEGFDGFDWDIEGNDDPNSPNNLFALDALDLMGQMSVAAKGQGYLVAMAPAQSYLDESTGQFSRAVSFAPHEPWQADFFYHGRNVYAYLLARYGVSTFDFISIQLYEGFSTANYEISQNGTSPAAYLGGWIRSVLSGWDVDFTSDPATASLGVVHIVIPRSQLVVGLANGWTGPPPDKFLLIWPEDCAEAYGALQAIDSAPLGFMFWNCEDEGKVVQGTERELWLARELATFLFPLRQAPARAGAIANSSAV